MTLSPATRHLVRTRAGQCCEYCHADERWQFVGFTIDHVLPRSAGGGDEPDNLALACRNCNTMRNLTINALGQRCQSPQQVPPGRRVAANPR